MKTRNVRRALIIAAGFLAVVVCLGAAWVHHLKSVHQHCMKIAGMTFLGYASEHGGAFPYHTNGFGDALLLLVKDSPQDIRFI
jgi:hypothetical protein